MHAKGLRLLGRAPAALARGRADGLARLSPQRRRGTPGWARDVRSDAAGAGHLGGRAVTASRMLGTGVVGTVIAALCCVTPVLAIVLGALGLSAWLAYADYVVLPALVAFL